ncbi:related to regulator of conidiation rca-1 [Fusarium oxysporum]|uniref:Related to regulator of conidiation rca-1 n=1 Tax=Fusarium oxysporum TaxID=5507 RepID=A0A2H3SH72_FUSOX|nr:related to regulator of conidiation rca-1 [Fusarium oxysporum]
MTAHRRGPWSNAEDAYLMNLVQTHGPLNWVQIAQTLGSRTPKQCRERYHQNLKPTLNHDPITPEEGLQIERLVHEMGKRWAEIARSLHGRSDNTVKNWWNGSQNRRRRMDRRCAVQTHDDFYPHNPPGLSISTSALPLTGPSLRHPVFWVESPLPSPCSSESAESDISSNHTTSPARQPISLHMPVELPPLRNAHSLSALASPSFGGHPECQPRLPSFAPQGQLPTAPNLPVQQESQPRKEQDSRMNLSSLLG